MNRLNNFIEFAQNYLDKYQNYLADEFQHFFFGSVYDKNNKFPVFTMFLDKEGRYFKVLGPDMPNKVMSVLYPTKYYESDFLVKEYNDLAKFYNEIVQPELYFGIAQTPFKVSAYKVWGNERVIKKLTFSEKLKGQLFISLSSLISEDTVKFIIKNFKKWDENIFYFPYKSDIHVLFKLPENINSSETSIYIELGRILKEKVLKKYDFLENSYKLPEMKIKEPSMAVFKVPAEKILDVNFKSIYHEFISKIEKIVREINKLNITS